MGVLILLIIASLTVASGFLIAFIWSVRSGQYDDNYTPSIRMLFDDKKKSNKDESE
ncbi:cbb3-type cytochrome oxidase assembly protein CcoS [Halocola ammonii]